MKFESEQNKDTASAAWFFSSKKKGQNKANGSTKHAPPRQSLGTAGSVLSYLGSEDSGRNGKRRWAKAIKKKGVLSIESFFSEYRKKEDIENEKKADKE